MKQTCKSVYSYDRVREMLKEAEAGSGSRQELASLLRVSTHTIQKLLKNEDLPDLCSSGISRRKKLAWIRTIARIAFSMGRDPMEFLNVQGMDEIDVVESTVRSEAGKLEREEGNELIPVAVLAGGLLYSVQNCGSGDPALERALKNYLKRRNRNGRAGEAALVQGSYCRSCMASLDGENTGKAGNYCRWCTDEDGNLLPREKVLDVMTAWFLRWQPDIDRTEARIRADLYMRAMPAWAEPGSD